MDGWSYSGDPASSSKDAIRFEIQDTVESEALLLDAEIEYAILQEAGEEPDARGLLAAAARCCEAISRKFSGQADTVSGSLQTTYSKQAAGYQKLCESLRMRAQGAGAPLMPAVSRSEKHRLREDRDRVQPLFRRRQHEIHKDRGSLFPGELDS